MKLLDKINLKVFSVIIIIVSVILLFFCFGVINDFTFLDTLKENEIFYITVSISILLIAAAIKSLFITEKKEAISDGVLLENPNGKLFITKDSIISMIDVDLKSYKEILGNNIKIGFNEEKDLFVELVLTVDKQANIKELSSKIQNSIKKAVKRSSDIDVKEINIKIKNVEEEKEKVKEKEIKNNI